MIDARRLLVSSFVATLLYASGTLVNYVSDAEEAILIPGAMPLKQLNPIAPTVAMTYPDIGKYFHGDYDPQLIDYSQEALLTESALRDGVAKTITAVRGTNGDLVIIGESMGSMVAWRTAEKLAGSPDAPTGDVRVVLIAPPEVGVAEYFAEGTYIPILNYRITRIRASGYDTTVVIGEYDGWSDPPDRPWNLIASANALAGIAYVHGPPSFTVNPADVPAQYISSDGNLTTYLAPTTHLPLTQVLRDVGVPGTFVDKADDVLRPIVDAGYVRHDSPGDTRPYLRDGGIHRNVQGQQVARHSARARIEQTADRFKERRAHRREVRQGIRDDVRERLAAGSAALKKHIADRRAERQARTNTRRGGVSAD